MKSLVAVLAGFAVLALPAAAENRYDRKIDKAAAEIVAAKMGELRGGFDYDVEPASVLLPDLRATGSIGTVSPVTVAGGWDRGLAPAVELHIVY
jgi:hypothetical protein